jgi:hypothetical protein
MASGDIHVLGTAPESDNRDVLLDLKGGCELRHMPPLYVPQIYVPYTSFSGRLMRTFCATMEMRRLDEG